MAELRLEWKEDGVCSVEDCYKKSVISITSPLLSHSWPICKIHKSEFFNHTQCSISGINQKQEKKDGTS